MLLAERPLTVVRHRRAPTGTGGADAVRKNSLDIGVLGWNHSNPDCGPKVRPNEMEREHVEETQDHRDRCWHGNQQLRLRGDRLTEQPRP